MMVNYGNYIALMDEPTTEITKACLVGLIKSIPNDMTVDFKSLRCIVKKNDGKSLDPFRREKEGTEAWKYSIAIKFQAEQKEEY